MARNVRSARLETRSARAKLRQQGKPHWVPLGRGLALGYRKIANGAGRWVVRRADGHGANWTKAFAHADDFEPSNGDSILTYLEAQQAARAIARGDGTSGGIVTVRDAIDRYAADLRTRGGRPYNAKLAAIHLPSSLLQKPVGRPLSPS